MGKKSTTTIARKDIATNAVITAKPSEANTANTSRKAKVQFGSTAFADTVPGCPAPSSGPVYLEGRLVLSLSFQGMPPRLDLVENDDIVLENYRLWDELSEQWHEDDLAVLRFEHGDVVMRLEPRPTAIWSGEIDTHARVILVPDLSVEGFRTNQTCDLCWKKVS